MPAKIIDGRAVAAEITTQVAAEAAALAAKGQKPQLAAVQVGANPASKIYTDKQAQTCRDVGIDYNLVNLPDDASQDDVCRTIDSLNADAAVTGIILQMPLPSQLDSRQLMCRIAPGKDVEGVHPENLGRLFRGEWTIAPATAMAARELFNRTCPSQRGLEVVIVGRSEIVGKPLALMLLRNPLPSATVTVCHTATKNLPEHTRRADVLIAATGASQVTWLRYLRQKKAGETPALPDLSPLITAEHVRDGAVVIDVAINRIPKALDESGQPVKNESGKSAMITVGDVDYAVVSEKASAITPVPGGVGPVTVAMLLQNIIACAKQ